MDEAFCTLDVDDLIVDLIDAERELLSWGVIEWGGPARCTEEMAVAMGFESVDDLFAQTHRLVAAVRSGAPLSRLDWLRVLLSTEIVFASNVLGSGLDWSYTSGMSDAESLAALRSAQRKLIGVSRLVGNGFGTRRR